MSRTFLHVDGDAFFASCEVAKNPGLRGQPVVTGAERGIVSAATYEAKALGITRGMPIAQVRRQFPSVTIISSDYETYATYGKRMYDIVRRYAPKVEEYGIDECFGEFPEPVEACVAKAREMKAVLKQELDITFSVGLGPTKVLAKLGSKRNKPDGFTVVDAPHLQAYLMSTPVRYVWGIGPSTAARLAGEGVESALNFTQKPESWVEERFSWPVVLLWHELCGTPVMELETAAKESYHSIQKTRTFGPPVTDPERLRSELAKNIESACAKARRYGLKAHGFSFFLKTQSFAYFSDEGRLPHPTNVPEDVIRAVLARFPDVFRSRTRYRATGITLTGLARNHDLTSDLFGGSPVTKKLEAVYACVDALALKYGTGVVHLAASTRALAACAASSPDYESFAPATGKRLNIPLLGEVT